MKKPSYTIIGILVLLWISSASVFAEGRLSRFERTAGGTRISKKSRASSSLADTLIAPMIADLVEGLFYGMAYGGLNSMGHVYPFVQADEDWRQRPGGSAVIPFVALELSHQWIDSDTRAWDWRSEVGLALVGLTVRRTFYHESKTDFELDTTQIHGVYRMLLGQHFEAGLAFGALELKGLERRDGFSFGLPMRWHGPHGWGLEYRPVWSTLEETRFSDHDLAVALGWRYAYLRAGYRWFYHPAAALNGFQLGLSLKW